jgi:ribosomal protein S25
MTKKQLILTIDEEIIKKAKKTIPNISGFVEECLKQYLGIGNNLAPTSKMSELVETISKSQLELYLINERGNIEEAREKAEEFEKDKAWRFLWNDYRVRLIPDKTLMASAVKELGIDEETLEDILDEVYEAKDSVDTDSWNTVYDWYKKEVE